MTSSRPSLWDISQTLRPKLPVWPGDTAFSATPRWSIGAGSPVNVARFETTTHAGSHADAPLHYCAGGEDSAATALDPYIGPCRLIDARTCAPVIDARFIEAAVVAPPPRVLFRTYERFPRDRWRADFTTIAAAAIDALARAGVRLVGIDSPSLDPQESKTMDAHHAVRRADMRILEGLMLDDAPAGDYELIALPLKLEGLDASPVRAVLREVAR
ncbi:MAG TPA: arylformamidase [Caulobacteraceae bacterium]|nr:arylformamidase [Caulobacteraceae bacterium]